MVGRTFRKALLVLGIVALCWQIPADAAEGCRWLGTSPDGIEWIQDGTPRGVRLVSVHSGWTWLMALELMHFASCENCPGSDDLSTVFWLRVRESSSAGPFDLLEPNNIVAHMKSIPGSAFHNIIVERVAAPTSASVLGLAGFRSTISVRMDSYRADLATFAVRDGCLQVVGYSKKSDSIDEARSFISTARIELYTPIERVEPPRPKVTEPFPLGDARKRAQESKQ